MEQALKSADLLLQGSGGFGLLTLDLGGVSEKFVRRVPLSTWFRFRAVVEKLSAPVVVLTPYPVVGTCSSLTVNLSGAKIRWSLPTTVGPAHARLAMRLDFDVQVAARCTFKKPSQSIRSPVLVEIFCRAIRRMNSSGAEGEAFIFSEMLPGPHQLWLQEAKEASYTSELRFAVVDLKARSWSAVQQSAWMRITEFAHTQWTMSARTETVNSVPDSAATRKEMPHRKDYLPAWHCCLLLCL